MKIPRKRTCFITLRAVDGSDIVTDQPVRFNGEPSYFVSMKGLGFKKIWESEVSVVYSQVSYSDLPLIAVPSVEVTND